ncbi:hypothetical protein NW759_008362 [Fusarium solani]|nr:hypothetical protein NW759_008362 [Fusarium solani]
MSPSQRQRVKGDTPVSQNNDPDDSKRAATMKKQQKDLKLRCPIRAHAHKCSDDGMEIELLACDEDQTFPAIDKLNEHLSRVHSLKYVCLLCKTKFPVVNKNHLASLRRGHPCGENPWPKKGKHVNQWNLMSQEQHDRWTAWTSANNKRHQPEDGPREKKAFWSWRKIYESLYPNTTSFPAASVVNGGLEDAGRMVLKDKDQRPDARLSGEPQQPSVDDAAASPEPLEETTFGESLSPLTYLLSPFSADRRLGQGLHLETGSQGSWPETSTGPESMAFSSTSGTTDNLRPTTPSFISFTDDLSTAWPFQIAEPHPYTGDRDKDIYDGNPQDFFRREDQSFPELGDEGDF